MGVRDRFPDPQGDRGVETVLFNSKGFQIGKVGHENFEEKFAAIREMIYKGKMASNQCPESGMLTECAFDPQAVGRKS
jgi:hypothetical protein